MNHLSAVSKKRMGKCNSQLLCVQASDICSKLVSWTGHALSSNVIVQCNPELAPKTAELHVRLPWR